MADEDSNVDDWASDQTCSDGEVIPNLQHLIQPRFAKLPPVADEHHDNQATKVGRETAATDGSERASSVESEPQSHSGSLLLSAAQRGDAEALKGMLGYVDPDRKKVYQARSALHLACGYGQCSVVQQLLQAGSDPMQFNDSGRTPLHEACQGGHAEVVGLLLEYSGEVDSQDRDGQSAAHIAAMNGELKCLKVLNEKGAMLAIEDRSGRQPCHLAAMRNHRRVLEFLYDCGIDLECVDELGKTPVHFSAQYGALDSLVCLIERDCDITIGDSMGNMPIHYAAWHDHLESVRFLIRQGSLMEFKQNDGRTPLHLAAHYGAVTVLHWLLEKGAQVNSIDIRGDSPAHLAGQSGKAECFSCLVHHEADLTLTNERNDNPVQWAKKFGHPVAIDKAIHREVVCPGCQKQLDFENWKQMNKDPQVITSIKQLEKQAYTSPLPKSKKVPTKSSMVSPVNKKTAGNQSRATSLAKRRASLGSIASGATFLTSGPPSLSHGTGGQQEICPKKKLPTRDLAAKYFGDYVNINDIYKFKS